MSSTPRVVVYSLLQDTSADFTKTRQLFESKVWFSTTRTGLPQTFRQSYRADQVTWTAAAIAQSRDMPASSGTESSLRYSGLT